MCPDLWLESGAVLMADSHDNQHRSYLKAFLMKVASGEIARPTQLFLMGDMFDLLVGDISYTRTLHAQSIALLDELAQQIPVYYLEGNHDFNLSPLFLHVKVIPLAQQPLHVKSPEGTWLLLHGDKYGDRLHRLYTALIRSRYLLWVLEKLDKGLNNRLSKGLLKQLAQKRICKTIENFEEKTSARLVNYPLDGAVGVMEGHFHQGMEYAMGKMRYINFSSFACEQSYFVVQCGQSIQCAKQHLRGNNV